MKIRKGKQAGELCETVQNRAESQGAQSKSQEGGQESRYFYLLFSLLKVKNYNIFFLK